jgi:two-component system, OmpR family, phosphate regulon sensor histidine kinase PhoR
VIWLILILVLAGVGILGWVLNGVLLAPLRRTASVVREIAAGERPRTFVARGPRIFNTIVRDLEDIWDEHSRLRKQISEEGLSHRAILSGMVEGVMVVDGRGVIRLVNDSFVKLFNLKTSPLQQTVLAVLRDPAIQKLVRAVLQSGQPESHELSFALRPPDLSYFAVSAMPLRNPEKGDSAGVVVVFHDISRLRQLEEVRRQFVANVSHELRTPLSILSGYLETLIDDPLLARKKQAEIFEVMERHSRRLNALLDDLLTLTRLESRADNIEIESIDVERLLRQIANDWKRRLARKKIALTVEAAPGIPMLSADAFRLEQVMSNLLENSFKYTPSEGQIAVTADATPTEIFIRVADNGVGIPAGDLPHIFERFYRVEKARTRETGGTGLGLSIVKHIIGLHGGRIEAESSVGKGTAITFFLPRDAKPASPQEASLAAAHPMEVAANA